MIYCINKSEKEAVIMTGGKLCRAISLCLVFLMLSAYFSHLAPKTVAADDVRLWGVESLSPAAIGQMKLSVDYSEENFYPLAAGPEITYGTFRGRPALIVVDEGAAETSFYGVFETPLNLSAYKEMCFELRAECDNDAQFSLTVTLSAGGAQQSAAAEFSANKTYDVYFPLSSFDERASIDHIYFTYTSNIPLTSFTMSGMFADDLFTYSHIGLFSADRFRSDTTIEITEDAIYPRTADGACYIEADTKGVSDEGQSVVARVGVADADTGTMILSVKGTGEEFTDIATLNLFPGENVYTFIYDAEQDDDTYRISFSGVTETEGGRFALKGVTFTGYKESITDGAKSVPGSISSCTLSSDGKSVSVKGTVSSSFVVGNMSGKLGVFAVDMWESGDPVLLDSADMSTLFDMTFPVSGLEYPAYMCRFFVSLVGEDGSPSETVSQAIYPSAAASVPAASPSILGVESDDAASPFDAAAAYTVVDVNIDDLTADDPASGRFHSYSGGYYYFDSAVVSSLDSTLGFYISSGLMVYVRLLFDAPEGAGVYGSLDTDDPEAVMRYAAAVDYLTERYSGIYGLFVGRRVNSFIYNSGKKDDLFLYANNYVRTLRITSAAAKINIPSVLVAVPLGDSYVYPDGASFGTGEYDKMSGVGEASCDPLLLAALLSRFMSVGGVIPWYLAYECESDPAGTAELLSGVSARLVQNIGASPSGHILVWRPDHEIGAEELGELSSRMKDAAAALGTKSLIVSLTEQDGDVSDAVSAFKILDFESADAREIKTSFAITVKEPSTKGHVFIKDFRRSYGVGDFFCGGAFRSLTTEAGGAAAEIDGAAGGRSLRAESGEDGGNGILMCRFSPELEVTGADYVNLVLCVSGEEGKIYPVTISVGSGTSRCEYTLSAPSGRASEVKCRIDKSFLSSASYFSVEVECGGETSLDISRISLSRDDGNGDLIEDSLGRAEQEAPDRGGTVISVLIGVTVFSVIIFGVISVKGELKEKKKNKERR